MGGEGNDYVAMVTVLFAKFPQYYDLLLAEKPIICERTGKVYDAIPKPSAAVIDVKQNTLSYPISYAH